MAILQVILKRFGSKGLRLVVDFSWFPNQPIMAPAPQVPECCPAPAQVGMIFFQKNNQKTTTNVKVGHIRKIHIRNVQTDTVGLWNKHMTN